MGSGQQDSTRRKAAISKDREQGRTVSQLASTAAAPEDADTVQESVLAPSRAAAKSGKQGSRKRAAGDTAQQPAKKRKQASASEENAQPEASTVRAEQDPSAEGTEAPLPGGGPVPEEAAPARAGGRAMRARVNNGVRWAGIKGPPSSEAAHSDSGSDDMVDASEDAEVAEQPGERAARRVRSGRSRAEAPQEPEGRAAGSPETQGRQAKPAGANRGRRKAAPAAAHQELGSGADRAQQAGAGGEETAVVDARPLARRTTSRPAVRDAEAGRSGHPEQEPEGQEAEQGAADVAHAVAAGAHVMPPTGGELCSINWKTSFPTKVNCWV